MSSIGTRFSLRWRTPAGRRSVALEEDANIARKYRFFARESRL